MKALILATCMATAIGFASSAAAQQLAASDGKVVFDQNCKACHGPRGIPPQTMVKLMKVPPLDPAYFARKTDDSVVVVLKKGRGTNMKPFGEKLSAEQMLAVARYIRQMATSK